MRAVTLVIVVLASIGCSGQPSTSHAPIDASTDSALPDLTSGGGDVVEEPLGFPPPFDVGHPIALLGCSSSTPATSCSSDMDVALAINAACGTLILCGEMPMTFDAQGCATSIDLTQMNTFDAAALQPCVAVLLTKFRWPCEAGRSGLAVLSCGPR